jgi:hypothetical protein
MYTAEEINSYNWTIDTIIRSTYDLGAPDAEIQDAIEELEGDYIAYIHENSLAWLKEKSILNKDQLNSIEELRSKISRISSDLWNVQEYRNNIKWKEIHQLANKILNSKGIKKRRIDSISLTPEG